MKINFFGDFVAREVDNIHLSPKMKDYISNADYNVVNFEAPIKDSGVKEITKSGPSLFQSANAPLWLVNNKFNIITLANNHIYDYGAQSLYKTIDSFKDARCVGAGDWDSAYTPLLIRNENEIIGIIALTHCEFGTFYDKWGKTQQAGTAWINHPCVPELIRKTKEVVDLLIVLPHAGIENIDVPLPEYRDLYRSFIDDGADAVIASHPHIIQGCEYYKTKPIFYSLGNFYFPWFGDEVQPPSWYKGLSLSLNYTKGKIDVDYHFISFDDNSIIFEDNKVDQESFNKLNSVLADNNLYMSKVNNSCNDLLEAYFKLFYLGGLLNIRSKDFLKRTINILLKRSKLSLSHLINNIRCESHRYAIVRALENRMQNDHSTL